MLEEDAVTRDMETFPEALRNKYRLRLIWDSRSNQDVGWTAILKGNTLEDFGNGERYQWRDFFWGAITLGVVF